MEKGLFHRAELVLGRDKMAEIARKRVIIFGIGGVGSWCAESLIRTGIRQLTIVDSDRICITNVNRQMQATAATVGEVKTEALKKRLLEINPKANITALQKIYSEETYQDFKLEEYDFIIDAIDSLENKIHLIRSATATNAVFISSMGAALRIDPSSVQVAEFWDVKGCHFARRIRKVMRRGQLPSKKFLCVFSEEDLENASDETACGNASTCMCPHASQGPGDKELLNHEWCSSKAQVNGSLAHMTAIYGFTIAGLVIKSIYAGSEN